MKRILIIGATSAIASACARLWSKDQARFFLVARDSRKLAQTKDDLLNRGASQVSCHGLNFADFSEYESMLTAAAAELGSIDIALIAHGTLPDQSKCETSIKLTLEEVSTNALSVIAILTSLANQMISQQSGSIAVISSVAGDRGRFSNYVYGAAKAAVSTFCSGLRARLFHHQVHLLTVKPGFVATPMTQNLQLPQLLVATPEKVATDILRGIDKKKNSIYTPWFWTLIMLIIKNIPECIFKRIKI